MIRKQKPVPPRIAKHLRRLLDQHGWTQEQLTDAAGVSQPTISAMLGGTDPKLSTAERIADAFGVKIDDLLGR